MRDARDAEVSAAGPGGAQVRRDLLESDARYFEWGAKVEHIGGADVVYMPSFQHTAAGCVVQRVEPSVVCRAPDVWLRRAEQKFAKVGGHRVRIYLHTQVPTLEAILRANDYRPRTELAFGRFSAPQESPTGLRLKRVVAEADWGDKLSLHEAAHAASERAPDGHAFDAKTWLDLERAKSRAGELVYLLAYMGVTPCATIGLAVVGSVLRIKNVLVHPHWRHRGIATRLFSCAGALAGSRQLALGVLAVEGGAGEALYRRAGFDVWASLFEWTAPE